jgi:hypothetical protein
MKQTRRQFLRQSAIGLGGMLPLGALKTIGAPASMTDTVAIAASDFLNSIGACSSITGRGETLTGTIEALRYTGIRFLRCGLEDRISVEDMIRLHKGTGARIAYGLLSGGTNFVRLLDESRGLASAGALLAVEGNNEPNNWGIQYQGEAGGRNLSWLPVARLQRDLYNGVRRVTARSNWSCGANALPEARTTSRWISTGERQQSTCMIRPEGYCRSGPWPVLARSR